MARILVIDDDDEIREILDAILTEAGHHVLLAADGRAGLELYRRERADCVITDLIMPKKAGIETIFDLLRVDPQARIIAMSGFVGEEFLEAGRDVGVRHTIQKPFTQAEVLTAVQAALRD